MSGSEGELVGDNDRNTGIPRAIPAASAGPSHCVSINIPVQALWMPCYSDRQSLPVINATDDSNKPVSVIEKSHPEATQLVFH